ncbi:MAG: tRNA pseudouridine(55) synthase TruB [Lachnospiraceae bacterium]|nr:tRNA pseudouridine(55) synthase TruB [Lachnospiraceae bacterium]
MNGILNVYKEQGYTSHDVVARLRGILHMKRIGHTGTLDPMAEGVLPVCVGSATRLSEFLTEKEKTYEASAVLGRETDTQDATGQILRERPAEAALVTREMLETALLSFLGDYDQIPPMYSALKVDGKKLYELARKGKEVERAPRRVRIEHIELLSADLPAFSFRVTCSRGTYVRTLCADLGDRLGCGAVMSSLLRTQSGTFSLEESRTLAQIEAAVKEDRLGDILLPVEYPFLGRAAVHVRGDGEKYLQNGNPLRPEHVDAFPQSGEVRVYDASGAFAALYRTDAERGLLWPVKMFLDRRS